MIDKINNTYTNSYYNNSRNTIKKVDDSELPKFMLGDDEGVIWERDEKNSAVKNNEAKRKAPAYELKDEYISSKKDSSENVIKTENSGTGFLNSIKSFFKNIFNFIWYGDKEKNEKASVSENADKEIKKSDYKELETDNNNEAPEGKDELIKRLIKEKDSDGIMDVLTEHGKNKPARCTTMLTYYDRHGNLVNSKINQTRVLKGDRNTVSM